MISSNFHLDRWNWLRLLVWSPKLSNVWLGFTRMGAVVICIYQRKFHSFFLSFLLGFMSLSISESSIYYNYKTTKFFNLKSFNSIDCFFYLKWNFEMLFKNLYINISWFKNWKHSEWIFFKRKSSKFICKFRSLHNLVLNLRN